MQKLKEEVNKKSGEKSMDNKTQLPKCVSKVGGVVDGITVM